MSAELSTELLEACSAIREKQRHDEEQEYEAHDRRLKEIQRVADQSLFELLSPQISYESLFEFGRREIESAITSYRLRVGAPTPFPPLPISDESAHS